MDCPTDLEETATDPSRIEAVTLSTVNGTVNTHLDEGVDVVYVPQTEEKRIQQTIAQLAIAGHVKEDLLGSITYHNGGDPGGSPATITYCRRDVIGIALEGNYDRDPIPWDYP